MIEVATLTREWDLIDRAEPETVDGTASALRTLWDDSTDNLTGVAFGVVFIEGKCVRVFDRRADLSEYVPETEVER